MKKMVLNEQLLVLFIPLIFGFQVSKAQTDPYNTIAMQKKAIIGIWMNTGYNTDEIGDHSWTMKFTMDGKCYWYYTGDDIEVYTYTIEEETTESGLTVYGLDLYRVSNLREHYGYEMYIDRNPDGTIGMSLHSGGEGSGVMTPGSFVFKKIKD